MLSFQGRYNDIRFVIKNVENMRIIIEKNK
jgi:hypothetical protein